ncbi:calcium-binding protein [Roseibaca sp. Y0-43]|uniref:calcium-binding protein n=1 Tax=Roseibaca sp. Y0-43 TaxID=2816854 RepID=UPI001D0CC0C2|nr:calcium-binding protein [Roseibaca sp. Y0-43]MCC1482859.1 hypothetical protein [Roseibaca sp. Y0-43]
MANITITKATDTIVGTSSDDLFIYDGGDNGPTANPFPSSLSIDGGDGIDVVDFVSADEGALLTDALSAKYDSNTGIATFAGGNEFTDVEQIIFENGTLDLSDPAAIAGQEFLGSPSVGTLAAGDTTVTFGQVEDIFVTVEGEDEGVFEVDLLDSDGKSAWDYTSVNGASLASGGVQLEQGTFSVNGDGDLVFLVNNSYRDGLAGGTSQTFTVEVGLEDSEDDENTTTATYTVTIEAPEFTDNADSQGKYDASLAADEVVDTTFVADHVTDALGGNDFVSGSAGTDLIFGNDGNDAIFAGPDDESGDIFAGGAGDDTIGGGAGNDVLLGDSAYDVGGTDDMGAEGDDGNDLMFGGAGDDQIITGSITGGTASGTINGGGVDEDTGLSITGFTVEGEGNDTVWAGEGNDFVLGDDGDDVIGGGAGVDALYAGGGNDTVYGGDDDDRDSGAGIFGEAGDDLLFGGAGDDLVSGGTGNDEMYGGADDDEMHGDAGADTMYGGAGDDAMYAGIGDDVLRGGAGDDELDGDDGNDLIDGGAGNDSLIGNDGADVFVFEAGDGDDTILDFDQGEGDQIDLSALDLTFEDISAAAYQVGGDTFIDYDGGTIQIDNFNVTDLTASDFIL